ncbi:MAG: HlyD family efflux transporter periplasmic adaptor subunit [Eubacteriales bacterium]|nr:HlyD family efflux transporter periplasmic adaptor subunit [Eubacteriales bacterium]
MAMTKRGNEEQNGFTRQADWSNQQEGYFEPSYFGTQPSSGFEQDAGFYDYSNPMNSAQQNTTQNAFQDSGFFQEDEDYFKPVAGSARRQPQNAAPAPPTYQGNLKTPVFTQEPLQMNAPGFGEDAAPLYPADDPNAPSFERIPYKAPPKKRNMITWFYIALVLLVLVLGVMGISQLISSNHKQTALVTLSGQDATYSGTALVVRNETVFIQDGVSTIRYSAEEGSHVSRGAPVCTVYTTGFNQREYDILQGYRKNIKDQQMFLLDNEIAPDSQLKRLDDMVMQRAAETQALVHGAKGNLLNQEERLKEAVRERQSYIKQKYPDDTKLTRLYDNETSQLQRIDTWTKQYSAPDDGIVSFYTDGLEGALNTSNYLSYSPDQVQRMLDGEIPQDFIKDKDSSDIYRLVRQKSWGMLMLADDLNWNPVIGDSYQMLIENFESTVVTAKIEGVTKSGGKLLVRLNIDSSVLPILYTRNCRIQLSKSTITYAVPSNAIITQGGIVGVVVMFAEGEYLIPVTVVSEDATQANVMPVNAGYLFEGMSVRLFDK